jgi:hypothetical protein
MSRELLFKQIALQTCATEYYDYSDDYLMNEAGIFIKEKIFSKFQENRQGRNQAEKLAKQEMKKLIIQKEIYKKTNEKYVKNFDNWEGQEIINNLTNQIHDFIAEIKI